MVDTAVEFSHVVQPDEVSAAGLSLTLSADETARAGLARRFGLLAIERLEAGLRLTREGAGGIRVTGRLEARVQQACVVSLQPVGGDVADDLAVVFRRDGEEGIDPETVDPLLEEDIEFWDGGAIDLGELVAQHLSLSLEPYPRADGVSLEQTGRAAETPPGPFDALKALKSEAGERRRRTR